MAMSSAARGDLMRLSNLFVRTLREDPADAEVDSHKLLVRAGYIRRAAPGIYTWLPLGLKVLARIEKIVRQEMDAIGAQEVHFPALLPREPYEVTGRWDEYGPTLFRLQDRKKADYLLAPTHEEMFTLLVKDLYTSYKDLPVTLYQIQTKYRDEARPRAGLIRGREFIMKDSYSFDIDDAGLDVSYQKHREAYEKIFQRLGLEYVIVSAMSGAMGGSRSEEFLSPSPIGEDTFVKSPGGYAANAEAVTTVVPAALTESEIAGLPAPEVKATPGAASIADLVAFANANYPRAGKSWEATDTLKNVVFMVETPPQPGQPAGAKVVEFPLVIGIPGDREIDPKRLEAALAPAAVRPAEAADFAKYPALVRGFIGPQAIGPQGAKLAEPGQFGLSAIPYLVDPRVVAGTAWISGANLADQHVFGLVAGRDFTADGTIEAAEVKPGDPAPDGSGPLELARGIEMGHIFQLGQKYAKALGLNVLDENGKARTVTMGSYGIGVTRALAALAEANHDDKGLAWPVHLAPAQVHLIATGKGTEVFDAANSLADELIAAGLDVIYDDRPKVSPGVKFADAELLGVPVIVVVGRGLKDGLVEVRLRAGAGAEVPLSEVLTAVQSLLT
ncbi:MAG: proline--tRNA ligase [Cellulomonadaceae bacterium]|nr:proline--tRNA ligase [Cellulomonadaceae bacterium]